MSLPTNYRSLSKSDLVAYALEHYDKELSGTKPTMLRMLEELDKNAEAAEPEVAATSEPTPEEIVAQPEDAAVPETEETTAESDDVPEPEEVIIEGPDKRTPEGTTPADLNLLTTPPVELLALKSSAERHPPGTVYLYNPATEMSHPASPALLERMDLRPITKDQHLALMRHHGIKNHGTHATAPKPR